MALHFSSLFSGLAKRGVFHYIGQHFYIELLMAGLFAVLWVDPALLGEKGYNGLTIGLFLEFILAHAKVGLGVVSLLASPKKTSGKLAIGCMSVFYFLFVGGICYATGNIITAVAFVLLCAKRIAGFHPEEKLMPEIGGSFAKAIWFVLAGGIGFLLGQVLPAPIENLPGEKGAEITPAWGVTYFVGLFYFERYLAKKLKPDESKNDS